MFSFWSKKRSSEIEMFTLNDLSLPPESECTYASCYCEENVWKLCEHVKETQPDILRFCFAVFISNSSESVPLWFQKSGDKETTLAVWDYHVIFIYKPSTLSGSVVYDLDSLHSFPVDFERYAEITLQNEEFIAPCHQRFFRVIPAEVFLNSFASDRSRMLRPDGTWIKPPPPYPCIQTLESSNNIADFISMDPNRGVGEVMNLNKFKNKFL